MPCRRFESRITRQPPGADHRVNTCELVPFDDIEGATGPRSGHFSATIGSRPETNRGFRLPYDKSLLDDLDTAVSPP